MASVRIPAELLHPSERLCRQLERTVGTQQVNAVFAGDWLLATYVQRCHIAVRNVGDPMVPVAVHKVVGLVGVGFRQVGPAV